MDRLLDDDTDRALIRALRRLDAALDAARHAGDARALEAAGELLERLLWAEERAA